MNLNTILASFILLAVAAFALLTVNRSQVAQDFAKNIKASIFGLRLQFGTGLIQAANTYDAAVETHDDSVRRTNDAAITARHLLWYSTGATTVALSGVDTIPLGTIDNTESSTGLNQTVLLLGGDCTRKMVASAAISVGDRVFGAASGKVANAGQVYLGQALTAAAADGDLIEVATIQPIPVSLVETVAATNVITAGETGKTFFLSSATEFVSTLPAVAAGLRFTFIVAAAPSGASYTIVTNSSANVIKGAVFSADLNAASDGDIETSGGDTITLVDSKAVAGDRVELWCDGTNWFAHAFTTAFDAVTITTAS